MHINSRQYVKTEYDNYSGDETNGFDLKDCLIDIALGSKKVFNWLERKALGFADVTGWGTTMAAKLKASAMLQAIDLNNEHGSLQIENPAEILLSTLHGSKKTNTLAVEQILKVHTTDLVKESFFMPAAKRLSTRVKAAISKAFALSLEERQSKGIKENPQSASLHMSNKPHEATTRMVPVIKAGLVYNKEIFKGEGENQDAVVAKQNFLGVFDGVSNTENSGQLAAALRDSTEILCDKLQEGGLLKNLSGKEVADFVFLRTLDELKMVQGKPEQESTALFAAIDSNGVLKGGGVGDCELYVLKSDGQVDRLYGPDPRKRTSDTGGVFHVSGREVSLSAYGFFQQQLEKGDIIISMTDGLGDLLNKQEKNGVLSAIVKSDKYESIDSKMEGKDLKPASELRGEESKWPTTPREVINRIQGYVNWCNNGETKDDDVAVAATIYA